MGHSQYCCWLIHYSGSFVSFLSILVHLILSFAQTLCSQVLGLGHAFPLNHFVPRVMIVYNGSCCLRYKIP